MLPCHIYMVYPDPPPAEPIRALTSGQQRLIAGAEILLCSSLPTQLAIGAILRLAGLSPSVPGNELALAPSFVFTLLLADSIVLIFLMVALTRAHGESPRAMWFGVRTPAREFALGLALVPLVFLMVGLVMNGLLRLLPGLHNVTANPLEQLAAGGPQDAAMLGVIAILAGGVREELQRVFLLRRFEQHLGGATLGVIVLSIAFGLGHFPQGWDAVIATGLLGAFWAVVYLRRRSSIAPMVSHAGFNSLEVLRLAFMGLDGVTSYHVRPRAQILQPLRHRLRETVGGHALPRLRPRFFEGHRRAVARELAAMLLEVLARFVLADRRGAKALIEIRPDAQRIAAQCLDSRLVQPIGAHHRVEPGANARLHRGELLLDRGRGRLGGRKSRHLSQLELSLDGLANGSRFGRRLRLDQPELHERLHVGLRNGFSPDPRQHAIEELLLCGRRQRMDHDRDEQGKNHAHD